MPPTTTKKKKPAKPKRIVMPTEAEINDAEKDVAAWVKDFSQDWAIAAIEALQQAPWPEKKEIPEWLGVLVEGVEWAVVALAPEIGAAITLANTVLGTGGKVKTVAVGVGILKPMEDPDIKRTFSDSLGSFRGKVEERIKDKFRRDWATDLALLRKDTPSKTLEEQMAYIWLQMFPVIDYDTEKYNNLKYAIIRALAAAIPVFKQQLAEYRDAAEKCRGLETQKLVGSFSGGTARWQYTGTAEKEACLAAIPGTFNPIFQFTLTNAEGKVKRAPMVLTWMSMCTKY
jgi:hypothetical protein